MNLVLSKRFDVLRRRCLILTNPMRSEGSTRCGVGEVARDRQGEGKKQASEIHTRTAGIPTESKLPLRRSRIKAPEVACVVKPENGCSLWAHFSDRQRGEVCRYLAEPGRSNTQEFAQQDAEDEIVRDYHDAFQVQFSERLQERANPLVHIEDGLSTGQTGSMSVRPDPLRKECGEALPDDVERQSLGLANGELDQPFIAAHHLRGLGANGVSRVHGALQRTGQHDLGLSVGNPRCHRTGLGDALGRERDVVATESDTVPIVRSLSMAHQVQDHWCVPPKGAAGVAARRPLAMRLIIRSVPCDARPPAPATAPPR